uniref:Putative ankyrin repeat protein n=1 Tax=Moumouvirus sp. 'Monve' TaxID=1128131 RepID=H2EFD1_9VIRU|nr:putative ankyrin repeat protein [Moumouvirus Monve]
MDVMKIDYEFQISNNFFDDTNYVIMEMIKTNCHNIVFEDNRIYLIEYLDDTYNNDNLNKTEYKEYNVDDFSSKEKFYLIIMLIKNKNSMMIDKILNRYTDINISYQNNLLLNMACRENLFHVVINLINLGVDVTLDNNLAIKTAVIFCQNWNIGIIDLLINNGANIHVDDDYVLCCASHKPYLFKYLIDLGYEYNLSTRDDYCLRQCIENYFSNKNQFYCSEPLNNLYHESGMIHPVYNYNSFMEPMDGKILTNNMGEYIIYDTNNKQFVMSDIIKYLLDSGANVNCCNGYIINYVVERGEIYLAKLLIKYGADLNLLTNDTLSIIIRCRNYEMVSFLKDNDINFSKLNSRPIKNIGFNKMINLLIDQGMNLENIIDLI